jgi:hypothetical protein
MPPRRVTSLKCGTIIPSQGCVLGGRALRVSPGYAQRSTPPIVTQTLNSNNTPQQHTLTSSLSVSRTALVAVLPRPVAVPHNMCPTFLVPSLGSPQLAHQSSPLCTLVSSEILEPQAAQGPKVVVQDKDAVAAAGFNQF